MTSNDADADSPSFEQPRARAIVAGHGTFPEGMVSAVQQITGYGNVFVAMSNSGLSGEDIEARLRARSEDLKVKVFFTDLPGGSATMAVRRMMRDSAGIVLVTGANLATLLEFLFCEDEHPGDAARLAAEKGRTAISAQGGD
jgi:N-acetylgalactosamine PTS system EIIA component